MAFEMNGDVIYRRKWTLNKELIVQIVHFQRWADGAITIDLGCLEKQKPTQMKKDYYSFVSDSGIS